MPDHNSSDLSFETATDKNLPTRQHIESLIYNIREQQVMLDRDLATLYGVETRALNQAVKRNIERFPEHFMFRLTKDECSKSQIVTLNGKRGENIKYLPYAFTDNGIAMLSAVLKSKTAISVSIRIMEAFTSMRRFIATNAHDRFMIIDDKVFHIGASIKDLGKKVFAFSLMSETPDELLSRLAH